MRKRTLGRTSIEVTELALGTWGLSGDGYGPVPETEQDAVIDRALAVGIRLFDTADCYADGAMERRLGARLPKDDGVVVVTKLGTRRDASPPRKDFAPGYLRDALDRSQERLARERVDVVLLHNPSARAFEDAGVAELFESLVSTGRIRAWGASVGSVEAGRAAIRAGASVLELAYNVFHARELAELEADVVERDVGVLARSVLSHGLLCGLWPPNKDFPSFDHRSERWNGDELKRRIQQLNAVRTLLTSDQPTLRSIAIRYVLAHARVSAAVLGPRHALQLDQLVREAGRTPPYLEPRRLGDLKERLVTVGVHS